MLFGHLFGQNNPMIEPGEERRGQKRKHGRQIDQRDQRSEQESDNPDGTQTEYNQTYPVC